MTIQECGYHHLKYPFLNELVSLTVRKHQHLFALLAIVRGSSRIFFLDKVQVAYINVYRALASL